MEETGKLLDDSPEVSVDKVAQVFLPAVPCGADIDRLVRHEREDGTLLELHIEGSGRKVLRVT